MKKNSESRHRAIGRIDSAYAAGVASTSTSRTETTVAIAELTRNGPRPLLNTCLYSSRVGVKTNFGGVVYAADSGLNEVSTIQNTGKKKMMAANHATVPQASPPRRCRRRRRGGASSPLIRAR